MLPPHRFPRSFRAVWGVFPPLLVLASAGIGLSAVSVSAAAPLSPSARRPPPPKDGDVLHLFDGARVYVVTNSSRTLADTLLEGTHPAERRVLTVAEWQSLPRDIHQYVTLVFLIDRQMLDDDTSPVPDGCRAGGDQVWTEVTRSGSRLGVNHVVTLSAPDAAWLSESVKTFRRMAEVPRAPRLQNVRSVAVVSVGGNAAGVMPLLERGGTTEKASLVRPCLLPAARWQELQSTHRLDNTDEVLLIDRSAGAESASVVETLCAGHRIGSGETVAWRESKPRGGSQRVVISAPNSDLLGEALRRYPNPLTIPETTTVLMSARDLRAVRRVAVAGVRGGAGGSELAVRLASRAATELRTLDTFEVLERAGLNEILGEVALGQAGITQAKDRVRVQKLAAADALLIVEVTDAGGHTEYKASRERVTPRLAGAPKKPREPSRLKYAVSLPGKEDDHVAQAITDALLAKAVGTKSDDEYRHDLNIYNRETLPDWQAQVDAYTAARERRKVEWREEVTPRQTCQVSGSLRLVDLTDGLVLWESPFMLSAREDGAPSTRTVVTRGEDSSPSEKWDAADTVPAPLVARTAETAIQQAVLALKGTALLPPTSGSMAGESAESTAHNASNSGRILDIDGDQVLIGRGQTDGLRLGDTFTVEVGDGQTVALTTTRVRPRTCDCVFAAPVSAALTAKVAVGMMAVARKTP